MHTNTLPLSQCANAALGFFHHSATVEGKTQAADSQNTPEVSVPAHPRTKIGASVYLIDL